MRHNFRTTKTDEIFFVVVSYQSICSIHIITADASEYGLFSVYGSIGQSV